MPREEVERNNALYLILQKINDAERYDLSDADPSHLSPAQLASEVELTQAALAAQFLRDSLLLNLTEAFPDFPRTLTLEELKQIRHPPDQPTANLLGAGRAPTMQRMKAAGYSDVDPAAARQ
jgi:hypothetical protein